METIKKVLDKTLYWITVVLFALLVIVVVWQVFSRQVVKSPATWTDEGARVTFVWLGLFASAYLFGERGHIAMEFLARKLPEGAQRGLAIFGQVVILAFAVIALIWGGWRASQNAWNQQLSALPFTHGQMYLALPVAGILISFYTVYYIINIARLQATPFLEIDVDEDPDLQMDKYGEQESLILPDAPQEGSNPADDQGKEA